MILSVEYRKAPRFTFPSQIEETVAVTRYILDQADHFGIDLKRVAIMGDSAGGALSATVAIKMRPEDPRIPHPLAMQVGLIIHVRSGTVLTRTYVLIILYMYASC